MHTEVKRSELLHALAAADGIARPNQNPLLECVLITATNKDVVTVAATDTALTIRATLASSNRKEGSIAIPAKRLRDVIKGAPDELISMVVLKNNYIEIKSGKARYKLAGIIGKNFPKIPEATNSKTATIDCDTLKQMIDRVLFSTSNDKTRTHLCAALLEAREGVLSMTSTDGHRLSRATCAHDGPNFIALVPDDALAKMARISDGDVEITFERSRIFVRSGDLTMSSPLVDAQYPPIDAIFPKSFEHTIEVDRETLIASIERTKITTSETRGMGIDGRKGLLVLSSENPDVGEVSDEIAAEGATDSVRSCVAPKYLLDPLARFTESTVKIKLGNELSPFIIEDSSGSYTAVVMPMHRGGA